MKEQPNTKRINHLAAQYSAQAYERFKYLPHIAFNIRFRTLQRYVRLMLDIETQPCHALQAMYCGRSGMDARVTLWMMVGEV